MKALDEWFNTAAVGNCGSAYLSIFIGYISRLYESLRVFKTVATCSVDGSE